jgi:two-component system nitrate/nitrite response regulator NarL
LIRVWIETASAVMRAGLQALLEGSAGFDLVESPSQADVVLLDELPERAGVAPIVVLSDEPLTSRVLRLGVHAILPREAGAEQIVAALYAASAGLIAIPSESSSWVVPADSAYVVENLTPREMETLEMLSEGLSNKQIAARLNISEHTAKFHVNSVLGKLDAATRTEAVMRGLRSGLLKV